MATQKKQKQRNTKPTLWFASGSAAGHAHTEIEVLRKYRYSTKQQIFWTDSKQLLNWTVGILARMKKLAANVQQGFWQGQIPKTLLQNFPATLARQGSKHILELCRVRISHNHANTTLLCRAIGQTISDDGTVRMGDVRMDENAWVLRSVKVSQRLDSRGVPDLIKQAALKNDRQLFIRLGTILASKQHQLEVDWSRCDSIACFLVENWCGDDITELSLPPLCIFTDQALTELCEVAFPTARPTLDSVRQWRKRLRLKQLSQPKIKKVTTTGNEILFT